MSRPHILALLLLLGACAEGEEPDPTPAQDGGPYNMIAPVPDPAPGLIPLEGSWTEERIGEQPALVFKPVQGEAPVAMFCDGRDGLMVERRGGATTGKTGLMEVAFGNARGSYAANEPEGSEGIVRAAVPFNDETLAQLRNSRDPITISLPPVDNVVLPGSPAVGLLIATCEGDPNARRE